MSVTIRPIVPDELPAFARSSSMGFGESNDWFDRELPWASSSIERAIAGFEGDSVVATSRNYPLDITVQGGATLHTAAISAVTVMSSG